MNILIFSLGEKGFSVVQALAKSMIRCSIVCAIGQDDGVEDDYSLKTVAFCEENGIVCFYRKDIEYTESQFDYFLAIGWRWIIRDVPQEKLIIFHDSLLPKYRGFAPLVNALLNKENVIGVTALLGAEEYDRGSVLLQKSLDVSYPTTIAHEISRISHVYSDLALELITKISNRLINESGSPQDENAASYSLWRDEDDYRINWNQAAESIEHFINCVGHPYRGASALLDGTIVRVVKARSCLDVKIENRTNGKVVFIKDGFPVVVCGEGLLCIEDLRNEDGKSLLPLKYFRSRFV